MPEQGFDIPLEQGSAKLTQSQFNTYLSKTGIYSIQFGENVKQYMNRISATSLKDEKKKVIVTKNW